MVKPNNIKYYNQYWKYVCLCECRAVKVWI